MKNQAYALCLLVCASVLVAAGCGSKNSPASPNPGFTPSGPLTLLSAFATIGSSTNFSFPEKIQYVNGKLWVTDSTKNNLQEWAVNGTSVTTITTFNNTTETFSSPEGIGINPSNGDIYIADFNNKRVVVFDSTGAYRTEFANTELSATPANDFARGAAVNSAGTTVYVAGDTGGIFGYSITATNPPTYSLAVSFGTTATSGASGNLTNPNNLKLDSSGNIWVADYSNQRLVEFSPSGTYLNAIATSSGSPTDLTLDRSGNIYVTNFSPGLIEEFDATGMPVTTVGSGLSFPEGAANDGNGTFYVTNVSSIVAFH